MTGHRLRLCLTFTHFSVFKIARNCVTDIPVCFMNYYKVNDVSPRAPQQTVSRPPHDPSSLSCTTGLSLFLRRSAHSLVHTGRTRLCVVQHCSAVSHGFSFHVTEPPRPAFSVWWVASSMPRLCHPSASAHAAVV